MNCHGGFLPPILHSVTGKFGQGKALPRDLVPNVSARSRRILVLASICRRKKSGLVVGFDLDREFGLDLDLGIGAG